MKRIVLIVGIVSLLLSGKALATPVQWSTSTDGNGHYYEAFYLHPSDLTWNQAKNIAANSPYLGMTGYLATITSRAENEWITNTFSNKTLSGVFLGGYQDGGIWSQEPAGGWKWITGEPWSFTNWNSPAEPNNFGGWENYLGFWSNGGIWNDMVVTGCGYVVEYNPTSVIPEPTTMALLGLGLAGLAGLRKRRGCKV